MRILFTLFFMAALVRGLAMEPTVVNLTNNGAVNWVYYDFSSTPIVHPLTGLYMNGQGQVRYLRIQVNGSSFLLDQYGIPVKSLQGPFQVDWSYDNKINKIKNGSNTLFRFYYDHDDRLEKIKNDDFDVLFALDYAYDGQLEKIDQGGFDYLVRFYYNHDDQLSGIKNDDFDYIWKVDYTFDNAIEEIKDDNYDERVEMNYVNGIVKNISTYNTSTQFIVGPTQIDYLHGYFNETTVPCGVLTTRFFQHSNFSGNVLELSLGQYPVLPSGWSNEISSITIPPGLYVIVYESTGFQGQSMTLSGNWTVGGSSDWWNDKIRSIQIFH